MTSNTPSKIIIAILALLASVSLMQGIRNAMRDSQDFQWDAAKALYLGINPYDVSLENEGILEGYDFDKYYLQMEANQFPSLLMILLPFTLLPPLAARYIWLVFNILFTAGIIWLLRKTFLNDASKQVYIILSLLMIAGTPYRNQLGVGQHTLFSFCMFLLAVYYSEYRPKRNTAVVSLALFLCYFKYTLTAPLALYFVYKKRYRELVFSIIPHVILTFIAALMVHDTPVNMILKPLKVSSALLAEGGFDITVLLNGNKISYVVMLLIMALLFVLSVKMPDGCDKTVISVLTLWSLVVTYHRTYDFFVIIVVAGMFDEIVNLKTNKICSVTGAKIVYGIVIFMVFFFLRIFSENTMSKIMTGGIYYAFAIIATYFSILCIKENGKTAQPAA